jgi:hypothetical protein
MAIIDNPDFEMDAGDYRDIEIIARDRSVPPSVVNVTGYVGHLKIARTKSSAAYIEKLTSNALQGSVPNGTDGVFRFYLKPSDFATPPTYDVPYFWECRGTSPGGNPYTIRKGTIIFRETMITTVP